MPVPGSGRGQKPLECHSAMVQWRGLEMQTDDCCKLGKGGLEEDHCCLFCCSSSEHPPLASAGGSWGNGAEG